MAGDDADHPGCHARHLAGLPGRQFVIVAGVLGALGPLPEAVQRYTVFSSGLAAGAKETEAAKALVKFLTAPAAAQAFKRQGMEPG